MESLNRQENSLPEGHYFEDYEDTPYFNLLNRLPHILAIRHLTHIINNDFDDEDAVLYLEEILSGRKEAVTETNISDEKLKEFISGQEEMFFSDLENSVLPREDNLLGYGTTARIKRYDVKKGEEMFPMAVKYLLTPTAKTLSASAEHDMLLEAERMKQVEEIEREADFEYLSVPHPYLHHQNEKIQCYGMQVINGPNLDFGLVQDKEGSLSDNIREKIANVDIDKLIEEVDVFFKIMHTYCIHGDIKPKNIMIDESGKFYLIDFGQSVLSTDVDEKAMNQFENLKDSEIHATKEILRSFIRKINQSVA